MPLPIHAAYSIKRLVDKLNTARKDMGVGFEKVLHEFANKDEKGAIVYKDGGPDVPEAKVEAFLAAQEAFGEELVSIDRQKLAFSFLQVNNITLSAAELSILEPLFHDDLELPAAAEKTA